MSLIAGSRLGPYEVIASIGVGGMGEVYKARDTRLGRDVAIKISAEQFTERFEREARAIAALNHANICTLHDIGPNYLVMEYIQGITLAERIGAGAIPLAEALPIARQIAEALEEAHEKGIVHRDLKPANIKITPEGNVKVLDFGLAAMGQASAPATGHPVTSPTLTFGGTRAGTILGTAAYMSPEQARGLPADKRADIWAYGVVLYEMLTGRRLFPGETISDTLAAVLRDEPDWNALPPETPAAIRRLLRRCIDRDRKKRLHDIGDARLEIDEARIAEDPKPLPVAAPARGRLRGWHVAMIGGAAAVLGLAPLYFREARPPERATVLSILPPENATSVDRASVSPDGRTIAFVAASKTPYGTIYLRSLDSPVSRALKGANDAGTPFWSPDGRSLAFTVFVRNKLVKVNLSGGPPQVLCDSDSTAAGAWGSDGTILIGRLADGLFRVSANDGAVTRITTPDPTLNERRHTSPLFLPGGRQFLYVAASDKPGKSMLYAASLDSSKRALVMPVESTVSFVPSRYDRSQGYLLFSREGALLAQTFDLKQLRTIGDPFAIAERIGSAGFTESVIRYAHFSASAAGSTLVYWDDAAQPQQLNWFDRSGKRLGTVGVPSELGGFVLSPDEQHVAAIIGDWQRRKADVWLLDGMRGTSSRLTFDRGLASYPVFSPDGAKVAFASHHGGATTIYQKSTSGTDAEEKLVEANGRLEVGDWSRDGQFLAYTMSDARSPADIWVMPLAGDRKPFPFLTTTASESSPRFSPDGKWLAYVSDENRTTEAGARQVYVEPFAPGKTASGKWQISVNGGSSPHWRRDGKELFYVEGRRIMAVSITSSGGNLQAGIAKVLFEMPPQIQRFADFASSADGQRFLFPVTIQGDAAVPITVMLNWTIGIH
jgi:eukaryotic-like serine/threonine-protein kinase